MQQLLQGERLSTKQAGEASRLVLLLCELAQLSPLLYEHYLPLCLNTVRDMTDSYKPRYLQYLRKMLCSRIFLPLDRTYALGHRVAAVAQVWQRFFQ